jgi:hypothetical protein
MAQQIGLEIIALPFGLYLNVVAGDDKIGAAGLFGIRWSFNPEVRIGTEFKPCTRQKLLTVFVPESAK